MDFAKRYENGHFGPRIVWRQYLTRLKYHNPAVSMTVNRTNNNVEAAIMTIFFSPTGSATAAAQSKGVQTNESQINERAETIDMTHQNEKDIWKRFMQITKAGEVKATEEEELELRQIEEERIKSEQDKAREKVVLAEARREQALLATARASVNAQAA